MLRSASLFPVAALAILLPGFVSASETQVFSGKKLRIHNLIGRATVVASTGAGFKVEITRDGEDAADIEVRTEKDGDSEVLKLLYPGDRFVYPRMGRGSNSSMSNNADGSFGGKSKFDRRTVKVTGGGSGAEMWADLRIEVPKGAELALYNAIGGISATHVEGEMMFDTASGSVEATDVKGNVSVDVGSGDIELTGVAGNVSVDTGSGDVGLSDINGESIMADTGSGDIDGEHLTCVRVGMDTGSGDITLDALKVEKIDCDTGSGSILVALDSDLEGASFDTGSGDVTLEIGPNLGASLDIETGSGDIDIDAPHQATRNRRNEFRGTVGDGKGTVIIETGSGDVRVMAVK